MLDMLMEIPSMQFLKEWDVVPESSTLAEDKRTDQRTDWSPLQHSHTYHNCIPHYQTVCARSYVHNDREISNSYLTRGFATYESSMWLKPEEVTQPSNSTFQP